MTPQPTHRPYNRTTRSSDPSGLCDPNNGTPLAFCAARSGRGDDWDTIDIVLRRSKNGGETWEAPRTLAVGHEQPAENPNPLLRLQVMHVA